jgi:hypothetical protein
MMKVTEPKEAPKPVAQMSDPMAKRIDAAMLEFKQRDGYAQRQFAQAVRLEQSLPEALRGVL